MSVCARNEICGLEPHPSNLLLPTHKAKRKADRILKDPTKTVRFHRQGMGPRGTSLRRFIIICSQYFSRRGLCQRRSKGKFSNALVGGNNEERVKVDESGVFEAVHGETSGRRQGGELRASEILWGVAGEDNERDESEDAEAETGDKRENGWGVRVIPKMMLLTDYFFVHYQFVKSYIHFSIISSSYKQI